MRPNSQVEFALYLSFFGLVSFHNQYICYRRIFNVIHGLLLIMLDYRSPKRDTKFKEHMDGVLYLYR